VGVAANPDFDAAQGGRKCAYRALVFFRVAAVSSEE
jgi:hypothetical protein